MSERISNANTDEFYRGVVHGNELSSSTWVGFLAASLLYRGKRG